jgi:hypothetical protein
MEDDSEKSIEPESDPVESMGFEFDPDKDVLNIKDN